MRIGEEHRHLLTISPIFLPKPSQQFLLFHQEQDTKDPRPLRDGDEQKRPLSKSLSE
jgi:hypothetical protein